MLRERKNRLRIGRGGHPRDKEQVKKEQSEHPDREKLEKIKRKDWSRTRPLPLLLYLKK